MQKGERLSHSTEGVLTQCRQQSSLKGRGPGHGLRICTGRNAVDP